MGSDPPPARPVSFYDLQLRLAGRHALGQGRHQRLGAFAHGFGILGEHAQGGDAAKRVLRVKI